MKPEQSLKNSRQSTQIVGLFLSTRDGEVDILPLERVKMAYNAGSMKNGSPCANQIALPVFTTSV